MLSENRRKLLTFSAEDKMTRLDFVLEMRTMWQAERDHFKEHSWLPQAKEIVEKLSAALTAIDSLYLVFLMDVDGMRKEIDAIRIIRNGSDGDPGDMGDSSVPDATGDSRR